MYTTIQFAPIELLDCIFQYLPKSSLLACSSVCRNWQPSALRLFYETVELSEKTKEVWLHMAHRTEIARNIGIFVRKLTINLAFSTALSRADFLRVISFVPFVKSIDLELSGYKLHYLSYLNERNTGCITHLEDINTGDLFTDYQLKQYFLCAYSFRDSLKHLTLRNPFTVYQINGQSGTAVSFLKSFEDLDHISIISDSQIEDNELANLFKAFQPCTKLVSFSYQNNHLQIRDEKQSPPYFFPYTNLKDSKLQKIELNVPSLTSHYIENILLYFPTNLKQFTVNMTQANYRDWIQEHNESFGVYLGLMKSCRITISNNDQRRYSIGRKVPVQKELSKFWQFFRSTIRNRHLFITLKFCFSKSEYKPDIIIERDEQNMTIRYNSENLEDLYLNLEEFSPIYSSDYVSPSVLDPQVNSVEINIPLQRVDDFNNSRYKNFIQTFISHTSQPQLLSIYLSNNIKSEESMLIQLECNLNNTKNSEVLNMPKHALLKNIDFQILPIQSITNMLSDLKHLKMIHCKPEFIKTDTQEIYILDLTEIKHLSMLEIDLSFLQLEQKHQNQILIQVEMTDKKVSTLLHPNTKQTFLMQYLMDSAPHKLNFSPVILIKCQTIDEIVCTNLNLN